MIDILQVYSAASAQVINYQKSAFIFSSNIFTPTRDALVDILAVRETMDPGFYLGLPSKLGRNKHEVMNYVKERIWSRLNSWKLKFLSKAGKEILLKTVI